MGTIENKRCLGPQTGPNMALSYCAKSITCSWKKPRGLWGLLDTGPWQVTNEVFVFFHREDEGLLRVLPLLLISR